MSENFGRAFGGMAALAVIWIIVYWWWEPRGGAITFDTGSHAGAVLPGDAPPAPRAGQGTNFDANPDPAPREGELAGAAGPGLAPSPAVPAVIPPRFRLYTVKTGDTLARIAERELGSRAYAEAIVRSNPLTSPENLTRPGREIRLPVDPSNVRGVPNPESAAGVPPPRDAGGPGASPGAVTEYTVEEGDTLSGISKAHYGSVRYADLIAQANGIDADHLKIGQKLRLPPKPQ
jgi:nucleoid-associated protein YgaU